MCRFLWTVFCGSVICVVILRMYNELLGVTLAALADICSGLFVLEYVSVCDPDSRARLKHCDSRQL